MSEVMQVTPLGGPEQQWISDRRAYAAQEGVDHLDLDAVSAYQDALMARADGPEPVDPEELGVLLEVVAVLLGEHLGARHGMQWVVVRDDDGADLGLRDPLSDAVVFPQAVVAERWNAAEPGWIPPYVDWLGAQLPELRAQVRAQG
ncbi:DUF3806 domain-containing protein [Micrococcus sp.]|uniref:DUF3806 domain-containing protein n=1 Tax=Micrococcus sp. TaxID=1271 RepID=UPI002A914F85|nr:DUF3806 domain-containing protein [Micrococcus sp.]MDY6054648.1 DUF3806 domain-containing protein [Micrococcus sp.]